MSEGGGHHQSSNSDFFSPEDAVRGLHCSHLQLLLICGAFLPWFLSSVCEKHPLLGWDQATDLNIPFLYIQEVFSYFFSIFMVVEHLHCEDISRQRLAEYSPMHLRVHLPPPASSQIISEHQWAHSTGSHTFPCIHVSHMMWCALDLFPLPPLCFSLPIPPMLQSRVILVSSVWRMWFQNICLFYVLFSLLWS